MVKRNKELLVFALIIISILLLYVLYVSSFMNLILRIIFAFLLLIFVGLKIQNVIGASGGYGLYMMGSKKGLNVIDNLSKNHKTFWEVMAVWGLTLGFGLLSYPLLKGKIDKRIYVFGIISIILIMLFVLPYIANSFQFINLPRLQNALSTSQSQPQTGLSAISSYVTLGITIFAGFTGSIFYSIILNSESILASIVLYVVNPSLGAAGSGIASQIPGVAPVIPGIDIPLLAGVISLALLLIIHEFSHGVLARTAKVKLKSIGLLVFGFIPIGGYVEPDEKMVDKLNSTKQTNIFSAGIAANFLAMIIFFVLVVIFTTYVIPSAIPYKVLVSGTSPNYPANNILKSGMQVLKWNNYSVNNITTLTKAAAQDRPNGTVTVVTNNGTYAFKAVTSPSNSSKGVIGVMLAYKPVLSTPYEKVIYFFYTLFSLSLLLNFLVAVVNLLPIPGFDGYRIYRANIKNTFFVNALGAFIIIMILVNVLPWLF
ncbi:MAG: site-2 protease family protein [Candidatus Micrarchaeaceae archaeon]|jgi:hypothetical protein